MCYFCTRRGVWLIVFLLVAAPTVLSADESPPARPPGKAGARQAILKHIIKKSGRVPRGVGVPTTTPWVWCAQQYEASEKNARATYSLIGEHLLIADRRYFSSKSATDRRKGLGMVLQACQSATNNVKDPWLALKICETYIRPHLDDADPEPGNWTSEDNIFEVLIDAYSEAHEPARMIEVFRMMIDRADNQNAADGARLRLAQTLEGIGALEEAIAWLEEIDDEAGVGGAKSRIAALEKMLADKKEDRK